MTENERQTARARLSVGPYRLCSWASASANFGWTSLASVWVFPEQFESDHLARNIARIIQETLPTVVAGPEVPCAVCFIPCGKSRTAQNV